MDWDPKNGPVWVWSTFDHLSLSHAPFGTADWTHANAIIYSPDDGDLILSMRNQNWILKINYDNGLGDGSILWHLGFQGDFTLTNGDAPIEWNYGQHYPLIVSANSSGIFDLMFFNNGTNRLTDASGTICGNTVRCYSSVPIFELDEQKKTVKIISEDKLSGYSLCCGSAALLSNTNLEFDVAADFFKPGVSYVQEVQRQNFELVWQMNVAGQLAYRGFRIPSLYPGVTWTQH